MINIYNNKGYLRRNKTSKKIIIFDFDETIGNFTDLYILWVGITKFLKINNNVNMNEVFNRLLDIYPEFLRTEILKVFQYIEKKKNENIIAGLYIYTNNQCLDDKWINYISNYIDLKIKSNKVIDKVVYAFKIKNEIIELNRTTNRKTIDDFINCTLIHKNTNICFLDNSFYQEMIKDNVYYIQPKSYYHNLSDSEILNRFITSNIGLYISKNSEVEGGYYKKLIDWFFLNKSSLKINKSEVDNKKYQEITNKILYHIKEFIYIKNNRGKTIKKNNISSNFTRKKRY